MFGQPNNFNNNGNGFGGGFGGQQYGGGFQQPQQAQPQPTQMTAAQMLDSIDSQSSKSFKFQNPGDSVSGVIESVTASQMHVYDSLNQRPTNQPDFFQDGSPKLQVIVTIDTGLTDPSVEDDDGRRSVYIKGYGIQRRAWLQAIRNAGLRKASEIKPGDRFTAKFVGYDPQSKNPNNPAKMYEYVIEHQSPVDLAMNNPMASQPQQAQQTVQAFRQAPAMQQPQQPMQPAQPQQPQQAAPVQTVQPTMQQVSQIQQLKALGKTPQEVAQMMGLTEQQVLQAGGTQPSHGSEEEPAF